MTNTSDISKEKKVVQLLTEHDKRISFAESCTAGLAAARLVNVPNASGVFDASFVTYANSAKIKLLGVNAEDIDKYGVVSEPVAGAMAKGCAESTSAQVGVGISGIAGPGGGSAEKPVGMVCFGFFIDGAMHTFTKYFGNIGRRAVREQSVEFVYDTLLELLQDKT